MKNLVRNRDGGVAVEFGLVILVITALIFAVVQTAYALWMDNMLHYAVDYAARCGAVRSTTYPCYGSGFTNMQCTADAIFRPAPGVPTFTPPNCPSTTANPSFSTNASCTGSGIIGTYTVSILLITYPLTAQSCYP
jgi:Flp pilus assembly protein TadG